MAKMDDLSARISSILNDPDSMAQIRSMAEGMLGGTEKPKNDAPDIDIGRLLPMIQKINNDVISFLMRADVPMPDNNQVREQKARAIDRSKLKEQRTDLLSQANSNTQERQVTQPIHVEKKVGRNDPCPCGSGKKYKNCHGKEE